MPWGCPSLASSVLLLAGGRREFPTNSAVCGGSFGRISTLAQLDEIDLLGAGNVVGQVPADIALRALQLIMTEFLAERALCLRALVLDMARLPAQPADPLLWTSARGVLSGVARSAKVAVFGDMPLLPTVMADDAAAVVVDLPTLATPQKDTNQEEKAGHTRPEAASHALVLFSSTGHLVTVWWR